MDQNGKLPAASLSVVDILTPRTAPHPVIDAGRATKRKSMPEEMVDYESLRQIPKPSWLPDWKDKRNYADHEDDLNMWAWEFLRRNPQYQRDYAKWRSVEYVDRVFDGYSMASYYADPPALSEDETVGEYRARTGTDPVPLEEYLLRKWDVAFLNDPAADLPILFSPLREVPPIGLQQCYGWLRQWPDENFRDGKFFHDSPGRDFFQVPWSDADDEFMYAFAFDIRLPIAGQIENARLLLLEAQTEMQKSDADIEREIREEGGDDLDVMTALNSRVAAGDVDKLSTEQAGKLLDALRVYDAAWDIGWVPKDIAPLVFGKKKTNSNSTDAKNYVRRAAGLAAGGYLNLMYAARIPKPR